MNNFTVTTILNTSNLHNLKESLLEGQLVHDIETGYCYCMSSINKLSFVVSDEDTPCLGSKCTKRELCYKYNEAKKFSIEDFIIRDLSIESGLVYDEYDNSHNEVYCGPHNRYRHFRWN